MSYDDDQQHELNDELVEEERIAMNPSQQSKRKNLKIKGDNYVVFLPCSSITTLKSVGRRNSYQDTLNFIQIIIKKFLNQKHNVVV